MKKTLSTFLIITLLCNFIILGMMGNLPVEAGLWEDNKDGIVTVIKGFLMLWIMNLIRENVTDSSDDIITSTIKKGLNIDEKSKQKTAESIEIEEITANEIPEKEQTMIDMVNEVRKNNELPPLEFNEKLTEIARMKARDMINNDYFDHYSPTYGSPFTMIQEQGVKYLLAGENLASSGTVKKGFEGLMNSPEHRGNILDGRYDNIGVGVVEDKSGLLLMVQLFVDSPDIKT